MRPLADRFWEKVERRGDSECWPWLAGLSHNGYGRIYVSPKKDAPAHRVAYELLVGPIPVGLTIDHLCRNRVCVNPAHMEPVTGKENTLRGDGLCAQNARKTHCKRGHEFTPENTVTTPKGRECRRCRNAYLRDARVRLRESSLAS